MDYEGILIRPPSEADSVILQATVGCPHNGCTFCPTYRGRVFRVKEREVVRADLQEAARRFPSARRLFVADGDALAMTLGEWDWLLASVAEDLPAVRRVGAYASARSVQGKTDQDLQLLRRRGLGILYLGVESGDDATLEHVRKGSTAAELLASGRRVKAAGIKLSATVLLGIAPPGRSVEHARRTGELLSAMAPDHAAALAVMVCEGTELAAQVARGEHAIPGPHDCLAELREMLRSTEMRRGLFLADHASNYVALKIRMPREKPAALARLDEAVEGRVPLRPERFRAL